MNTNPQISLFPESITNKYQILEEMGRGAFSNVYKIQSKIDNKIYCLKKLNLKKTTNKTNEINILSKLSHPNLVKYITSIQDKEGIYIIMEFCEYGDLYSLLRSIRKKKVFINEDIIWDIAYQSLLGLEYLHNQNIIHRDIKLLNIFMSKDKIIKIGDMGMSKLLSNKEMKMSRVGTPLYLAPELVKKEKYDFKADIWSLGCSLYHLSKTVPPFNDENLIRLGQLIVNEQPSSLPDCYTLKLNQFIMKLMTKDKNKRPSASEAIDLIPERIKIKYNNKHHNYYNNLKSNNNNNNNNNNNIIKDKNKKKKNNNDDNNLESTGNSSLNYNKNNGNLQKKENVISAGKTFYRFFKNFPEKKRNLQSRRGYKIISINNINEKFDNINNINDDGINNKNRTQFNFFNAKLISSNLMSKSMNNTQEGFFKRNDSANNNQNLISNNNFYSTKEKFFDSKNYNFLLNTENDEMKEDINSNVLRINQENLRNKRLNSSNSKKEKNKIKNELNKNHYKTEKINNKPIVKSEDFNINNLGIIDNKNNTNLIFPMIKNNNILLKDKKISSKFSKMNRNKIIQQTENSGFNLFRKNFKIIPNKILTIHDLK